MSFSPKLQGGIIFFIELQNTRLIFNIHICFIQRLYYSFIHTFSIFTYSCSGSPGGCRPSHWAGQGDTFMQIHTCRQFAAISPPDLHFCGRWADAGAHEGNSCKHKKRCCVPWCRLLRNLWCLAVCFTSSYQWLKEALKAGLSLSHGTHALPEVFSTTILFFLRFQLWIMFLEIKYFFKLNRDDIKTP